MAKALKKPIQEDEMEFCNLQKKDGVHVSYCKALSEKRTYWEQHSSFLIHVLALLLFLFFWQPRLAEAALNRVPSTVLFASDPATIKTHLYELQPMVVELEAFSGSGGAIEPLKDKILLVSPRGRIALISANGEVDYLEERVPFSESATGNTGFQLGLRVADIMLREQQPNRFTLFVSHHYVAEDCVEFRISSTVLNLEKEKAKFSGDWKTVFTAEPCIQDNIFAFKDGATIRPGAIQAGGRMLMDGAEHLLIVIGDHAWHEAGGYTEKTLPVAGPDSHLGKLVRIELASGRAEIIASGFRNPQGFARDADGRLWQTEHGPQGGDELNLLKPDLNYGWPLVTLGHRYGSRKWPYSAIPGRHDGFEKPVFAWIPSIAISNLIISESQLFPLWQGDLLIASLISQSLYRVRLHEGRVMNVEQIEIGTRVRDIAQMPDGRIALLSDHDGILFLRRAPIYCHDEYDIESIYSYDADDVCIDISETIREATNPMIQSINDAKIGSPVMRSLFNVYVHEDTLVYVRSPCSEDDISHRFFLHITPANTEDLAQEHTLHGFNVYDFNSSEDHVGKAVNGTGCVVAFPLPDYAVHHIYTGQVIREESPSGEISWRGPIWEGSHTFNNPDLAAAPETAESPYAQLDENNEHPGTTLFVARCGSCHNLAAEHHVGPHLNGVIGRRAGDVAGFNASAALSALDIVWTKENLAEFIANPAQFAPGTTMSSVGITDEEAQHIAEFLAANN